MLRYEGIVPGRFCQRVNRFTAWVELAEGRTLCHVKNTGRCAELLRPGAPVWCQHSDAPGRKTAYTLITVARDGAYFNLDSTAPNALAAQWLASGGAGFLPEQLRREVSWEAVSYTHLVWLRGASATAGWYEVPYVGSTTQIKQLKTGDTFEDGKVYLATLQLRNQDGFRFGDGFTVTFRQKNESASNYALLKCVSDTAKHKEYNVWYTVGDVTPQPVTELAITGPALQPDGSLATDDLTAFSVEDSVITSASLDVYKRQVHCKPQLYAQLRPGHFDARGGRHCAAV